MREATESVWLGNKTRYLVLWCIVSYALIHDYDTKWNLPILAWQLVGVFAGSGWVIIFFSYTYSVLVLLVGSSG